MRASSFSVADKVDQKVSLSFYACSTLRAIAASTKAGCRSGHSALEEKKQRPTIQDKPKQGFSGCGGQHVVYCPRVLDKMNQTEQVN
jgi:hypothetical protein